jgi:hypothetical protein
MTCPEFRSELMEWARGEEPQRSLAAHVSGCSRCARYLEEQQALTAALDGLAMEEFAPSAEMQAQVMAEFDGCGRAAKVRVSGWSAAGVLAAAASLFLFVGPQKHSPAPPVQDAAQFVPIPYTIPLTPEERATVVRMEIPVSALIAAGFRVPSVDPGATVRADVLVSQDGRARAIRPISISSSN